MRQNRTGDTAEDGGLPGKRMKVIGITGGVGCGKTLLMHYLKEHYKCRILLADEAAKELQRPGGACYGQIVSLLGKEITDADGVIVPERMAQRIFRERELLEAVNAVVHPAVRQYIVEEIEKEREKGEADFFFLEAALLIECGYTDIVEEMWYVFAEEGVRRQRLKAARGYTDAKIDGILQAQLPEEKYRECCGFVIDNSGEAARAYEQIDHKMGEYVWKR